MTRAATLAIAVGATLATAVLAGCDSGSGGAADGRIEIVASTNVYADIAGHVGGDRVDVTSFISSPSQDPHSYEASGRDVLAVTKADLVIENGGGYDDFMRQFVDTAGDGDRIVLDVVAESGLPQPASGAFNEHVWYDVATMAKTADAIAGDLAQLDPGHAADYRANAADFDAGAERLIRRESALKDSLGGAAVAITEPVPLYLLDALGLVNKTPPAFSEAVEEGEDVSVSVLAQTLGLFKDRAVSALVYNEQTAGLVTDQVLSAAADADVPVVPVTETMPADTTYLAWMAANLRAIAAAVDGSAG